MRECVVMVVHMTMVVTIVKRGYNDFKYYADAIHSGLTTPG